MTLVRIRQKGAPQETIRLSIKLSVAKWAWVIAQALEREVIPSVIVEEILDKAMKAKAESKSPAPKGSAPKSKL